MNGFRARRPAVGLVVSLALVAGAGCKQADRYRHHQAGPPFVATGAATVLPRTDSLPTYPCTRCHNQDLPPNPKPRKLDIHARIELKHMKTNTWCYTCHSGLDFDKLQLPNGSLVSFDESYLLCGSCHGEKLRDWKLNVHGLQTGYWHGPKTKRACPACHSPHQPPFQHMKPLPPPRRPRTVSPDDVAAAKAAQQPEAHR